MSAAPDLVLHRGNVLTQDAARPRAEALAVREGRVVALGTSADVLALAGPGTRRVDLGGRTVVPGFCDAHMHVWKVGDLLTRQLDLRPMRSLAEIVRAVAAAHARAPEGAWVLGRGYNEALLAEGRPPTRHDLDAAAPGRPVHLTRTCGHISVSSSRALALAGVTAATMPPPGGAILRDQHGEPTGILHETAMSLVGDIVPEPSAAELEAMIVAAARRHLALGITSATDAGVAPAFLDVYRDLDRRGQLPYRVNVMALRRPLGGTETLPLPERTLTPRLRIDTIKLFADGGLSGATAALRERYRHADDRGLLRLCSDELVELGRDAHRAGLRVATHAIGDRAIDVVLDAYEKLAELGPGPRHRLEHCGLPHPDQLERAARLGVVVAAQPVFVHALGATFRRYLPDALVARVYPLRDMLRAGLRVALSSDAPVVADESPLLGLRSAMLRRDAEGVVLGADQALGAEEALFAYTLAGAQATGDAAERGSLSPGKWADLVVLSGDPTRVDPEELLELRVEATYLAGTPVYER